MTADVQSEPDRREVLAFIDRHWNELTLRDARSLCVEIMDSIAAPAVVLRVS